MPSVRDLGDGVELIVDGREELAARVVVAREELVARALRLMGLYLGERFASGTFHLDSIEIFAARDVDRGDLALSFSFTTPEEPEVEGYTRFDVFVTANEPPQEPFHPIRFAVAFW